MKTPEDRLRETIRAKDRHISRMTNRYYDLAKDLDYIRNKLEGAGMFADAEILRMSMRKIWR